MKIIGFCEHRTDKTIINFVYKYEGEFNEYNLVQFLKKKYGWEYAMKYWFTNLNS